MNIEQENAIYWVGLGSRRQIIYVVHYPYLMLEAKANAAPSDVNF